MSRFRIPRKFSKFSLVNTSETTTDPDEELEHIDTISLQSQSSDEHKKKQDPGCLGWMKTKWFWRLERERKNRLDVETRIQVISEKLICYEGDVVSIEEDLRQCKKNKNKNKARLLLLKRKRLNNTIQSYYNSRAELEQVLISLEESNDQVQLVESYKTANRILKSTMRKRGGQSAVETYEDLADDLQEAQDDVHELQTAVSQHISCKHDDVLEEEFNELFGEDEVRPTAPSAPSNPPPQELIELPSVPTNVPKLNEVKEKKREQPISA